MQAPWICPASGSPCKSPCFASGLADVGRLRPDAELVVEVHPHLLAPQNRSVSDIRELLEPAGFVAYRLPVDFSPPAHLEPASARPRRLTAPSDELVHMLFSRRLAAEL